MLRAAGEHSAQDLLSQIAIPALVVAGERDSFTPPELSRAMADAIPESEFVLLPQSTHLAPLERDAEVASAMQSFLERRVR
jgi:pimeloyl-ACP methyl ester carboxylesterase